MKCLLFLAVITVSAMFCDHLFSQNLKVMSDQIKDQRLKLKNLAFCVCQSRVDSNRLFPDDGSAAGFKAYSAYDEDMYLELKIFTIKWIKDNGKNYTSYDDSPLSTMKCLDYYNSKELNKFILRRDQNINKKSLKDIYEYPSNRDVH